MNKQILIIFLLIIGLSACASPQAQPVSPVVVTTTMPEPGVASTPLPPEESPQPGLILQAGELILTISSPGDGEVTTTTPIELRLRSNEETVLTINGEIYLLNANQEYTFPVELEDGYNSIELVASDYAGDQVEKVLTVILEQSEE